MFAVELRMLDWLALTIEDGSDERRCLNGLGLSIMQDLAAELEAA